MTIPFLYQKYKYAMRFLLIMAVCVALSMWLSRYIDARYFDNVVTPVMVSCSTLCAFVGSWMIFRHAEGLRVRKVWGWTLLAWGVGDGLYVVCWLIAPNVVMNMGAYQLTTHELLIGNLLGWMLLLYPTEALRPGWMNWRRAVLHLLPLFVLVALDYVVPLNMAPAISMYPFVLLSFLISHVRAYRIWCEENFSTLDDIDVQWIVRYMSMVVLTGIVFMYICLAHSHTRAFTQLWLVIFLFIYGTEQILFRRDPWLMVHQMDKEDAVTGTDDDEEKDDAYRVMLEQWMESEKPFLNTEFRLMDLQQVLPMNRTYLSRFLNRAFGCTFYQFVNGYRVEEAMWIMEGNPDVRIGDVSARCGFSSTTVFTRTFKNIAGITPREWMQREREYRKNGKPEQLK